LVVGFAMLGAMTFLPTYLQYVHGVPICETGAKWRKVRQFGRSGENERVRILLVVWLLMLAALIAYSLLRRRPTSDPRRRPWRSLGRRLHR
jgi:hypothetical protein